MVFTVDDIYIIDEPNQLEKVLQNCTKQRLAKAMNYTTYDGQQIIINSDLIEFHNSTHHIDNINCEWLVFGEGGYDEDFTDDFETDYTENFEDPELDHNHVELSQNY